MKRNNISSVLTTELHIRITHNSEPLAPNQISEIFSYIRGATLIGFAEVQLDIIWMSSSSDLLLISV